MDNLQATTSFLREGKSLDEDLWRSLLETRRITSSNGVHDVVNYPGAYIDFTFPLAMVDANTYRFIDPVYGGKGSEAVYELILRGMREIGINPSLNTNENRTRMTFPFAGKNRFIEFYPQEASTFTPNPPADVLLLKNTNDVFHALPNLSTSQNTEHLFSTVEPTGTVISYKWMRTDNLPQGFEQVFSAPVRGILDFPVINQLRIFRRTPS